MMKIVVFFALVAFFATCTDAIKCYTCYNCDQVPATIKAENCTSNTPEKIPGITINVDIQKDTTVKEEEYQCYSANVVFGEGTIKTRGCIDKRFTCEISQQANITKGCSTCTENECNPANNIKSWTLSSVLLVVAFKLFL